MTIAGSLANALSGLTASSRAAELVSSNVANAQTQGYGRREIELESRYLGGSASSGVNVVGVRREVDMQVLQDRRLVDAQVGYESTLAGFHARLENIVGTPDEASSLSGRVAALEAALIEAGSRPDNEARLAAALNSASALADNLNAASDQVQALRMNADSEIDAQVRTLNEGLRHVFDLNVDIKETIARGQDPSALMDMRQQAIDSVSQIVPLKQVDRGQGMIALYTTGGAIVLDGRPAELGFSKVGVIVPEMTMQSGALSGLTLNGNSLRTDGARSPIQGGSLAALFEVRDERATAAQARLDAVARNLVERFQDPGLDSTRSPGAAGLFTDRGSAFDSADEVGLSGRVAINARVDPDQGGALWRLRDGLGAATPGEPGNSQLIQDLRAALVAERVPASGDFLGVARGASGLVGDLISMISAERNNSESRQSYAVAQQDSLTTLEQQSGVDTDQEMQKLMLIEQAYVANAKVVTTVSEMLDALMGI